ncbi:MAG: HAD family hydrolase [Thermoleophilia bacterium]|nr:HAD family hydrolase [Thermoleophilia bacterium]
MKYEALIFDVDGTLWDAARVSSHGWNVALDKMGLASRVTVDDIRSVSGNPFPKCVEILLPELHPASQSLLENLELQERVAFDTIAGELYEGVGEGLPRLAEAYPVFLVSNCPDWYLNRFLEVTGFGRYLSGRDCHGLSGVSKREMLLRLRRHHAIDPGIYVGDTQGDYDAALAAGLDFAFAGYGFGTLGSALAGHSCEGAAARAGDPSAPVGACLSFDSFGRLVDYFLAVRES